MNLNSFSLATAGGDNNINNGGNTNPANEDEDGGVSTGTIIILATVIPISTLSIYDGI